MNPILVNSFLTIVAVLVAVFAFLRWRKKKRIWYIFCMAAALLAGAAFWLSKANGTFLLVCALLLFGLAELFKKKVSSQ